MAKKVANKETCINSNKNIYKVVEKDNGHNFENIYFNFIIADHFTVSNGIAFFYIGEKCEAVCIDWKMIFAVSKEYYEKTIASQESDEDELSKPESVYDHPCKR